MGKVRVPRAVPEDEKHFSALEYDVHYTEAELRERKG